MLARRMLNLFVLLILPAAALIGCGGSSPSGTANGVGPAAQIALAPASASLAVGATQQFNATVKDANGNLITGASLTWASSAAGVATVNASGLVGAVAAGTADITAAAQGVTSAAAVVTVTAPAVASVALSPAAPSIAVGATQQFTATARDAGGNTVAGATFTWASSAPSVATVGATGLATGVAAGTSSIAASSGGVTSAADVLTVVPPPVAAVTVTPASPSIDVGTTQQFTATARDANGNVISGATFTWASSAASVATVNSSGLAAGVAAGTANITAQSGSVVSANDVLTVVQPAQVSGTVAVGAPLAGVLVTLEPGSGAASPRTATTAADGTYAVDTTGLTPPFLLSVTPNSGPALYSVSADANAAATINIDPLTDLILRAWYSSQGASADSAFANPASNPPPAPAQLQPLVSFVQGQMQLWLNNQGVAGNFNLIDSAFSANGSGFDKVLDETAVSNTATGGSIAVTDGTTTQTTALTYTPATNSVSATTTTVSGSSSSTSTATTVVPVSDAQAAALAAIDAQCAALSQTMTAQGANLANTDLEPFMTATLQFQGLNESQFSAEIATFARGNNASLTPVNLNSLDTAHGKANVAVVFQLGDSQLAANMFFVLTDGAWLLDGDEQPAEMDVSADLDVQQIGATITAQSQLNADVKAAPGLVTAASVSGGPYGTSTALSPTSQLQETFAPTPGGSLVVTQDHFNDSALLTGLLPANTPITFNLATGNGPVAAAFNTNADTTEAVQFTNLTSSSLSALTLGSTDSFSWTLPKTFAVGSMELKSDAFNGNPQSPSTTDCRNTTQLTSVGATTGSVVVPASCSGAVTEVDIVLTVTGVHGEVTEVTAVFQ